MTTIREALTAAMSKSGSEEETSDVGGGDDSTVGTSVDPVVGTEESAADGVGSGSGQSVSPEENDVGAVSGGGGRARGPDGKFAKATGEQARPQSKTPAPTSGAKALVKPAAVAATNKTPVQTAQPGAATNQTAVTQPPAQGTPSETKAPQGWKPQAREKWSTVPPEIQAEVVRREKETAAALSESAASRKFHDEFRTALTPYQTLLGGQDPIKATTQLMQMAHNLQFGPANQKAALVAHLVKQFGVDIGALDQALAGQPQQAQQGQPQAMDAQAIAAQVRQQMMAEMQQRQAQEQSQKAHQSVEQFGASKEFFADVRETMAKLLQGGVVDSLEKAYDAACQLHPDVSAALKQRAEAEQAKAKLASTQQARAASSSVKSQPAGAAAPQQGLSRRDALLAAMAKANGR